MLCSAFAAQVAGDALAPIFQPADQFGRTLPGPDLRNDGVSVPRQVEAYHWGQMTSGGPAKAIWALLTPFALINVAHWMLPPGGGKGPFHALIGFLEALLRLAGLLLTSLFMTQAAILVMDLGVNQCPAEPRKCLRTDHLGWLWTHQRFLSIAGALLLVAVLWVINHISAIKWDSPDREAVRRDRGKMLAEDDSFYGGDADAPLLRATHLTAGLSVVVVLLLDGTPRASWLWMTVWLLARLLLLSCGLAALFFRHPRKAMPSKSAPKFAVWASPALALTLLMVTAAWGPIKSAASAGRKVTHHPPPLPGSDDVVSLTMIALGGTVVLIVVALVLALISRSDHHRDIPSPFRPYLLGGFAAPITILGSLLGAGLGAGYTYIVAGCLSGKCSAVFSHRYGANSPLRLPAAYESLSQLWAVTGIVIVAGILALAAAFLTAAARAAKGFWVPSHLRPAGIVQGSPKEFGQRFKIALTWQLPRWRVLSARLLTGLSVVIAIAAALCLEAQWATAQTPLLGRLRFLLDREFLARPASALGLETHRPFLAGVGAYVVTVFTIAFLVMVYNAARRPNAGRALGILWDLASYWPRAAHPFVPPCYAQKAVPDLLERAHRYIEDGNKVVLSAHSQGSLITIAVALRMKILHKDSCANLGLVMAGSQLQWAYPRAFPAVVDLDAYQRVLDFLNGRWYVLVRGTDPLGGPVLSWNLRESGGELTAGVVAGRGQLGEEDRQVVCAGGPGLWIAGNDWWISDPRSSAVANCGFALPVIDLSLRTHFGYWSHPQWDHAVAYAAGIKADRIR